MPFSFVRSLLLIASLSSLTAAQADGLYVEGGTLARRYDLTVPGAVTANDSAKGHVLAPLLRLGYALDERWAVEAGYASYGAPSIGYRLGNQDGRLTSHGHAWLLGGRASLALGEGWSLVGRLGLARNQSSLSGTGEGAGRAVSGSATALYGGLGLETAVTPHWHLGLAWEHLGMNRSNGGTVTNGISTTLRYKF